MRTARNAFLVVLLILVSLPVQAQYFGQNKVQWENFDFRTLRTEHFDIYYYPQEEDVVHDIGRMAERWYTRLSRTFGHSFTRKPIVLYANPADFHQTTTTGGFIGEGTGGFTDAFMNRVVLPLTGDYAENDHVLGHEIVHVFQYDIAASAQANRRRFNLEALPLWLVEGMAEYLSKGRIDPLTSMWIRDATINNRLPDLKELTRDPRYFPYRYGQALMAYIGARFGDDAVIRYFLAAGTTGIEDGIPRALGISGKQLFTDWQESARELYNPVVQTRTDLGNPLIGRKPVPVPEGKKAKRDRRANELNVGPAISPDGRYIAFISARELFSIDLFLADAKTGKVIRQLVSSDRDAHFESLRFIESGGSFSPDGERLAFITFAKGDNFLSFVDVNTRRTESVQVPNVDALTAVAWSPDGRTVAISGQRTGVSDLFLYNLDTKEVRQLTSDKYADLQPAFSPDGRTIVFVTDRGTTTSLEQLQFSDMTLATVDVASGQVTPLPLFPNNTRHINPHYAPNGDIVFIGNPEGVPDIYRYRPSDRSLARVTNVRTGVAGITDMSPALSVALRTGDMAFSVYEGDNYNIYTLPGNAPATAVSTTRPEGVARAALLPPLRGAGSEITAYLNTPQQGLPNASVRFEERRYDPSLHLAYLGPPTIGATVGGPYGGVGGTVSAYFTDILGQHNVGFTFVGGGSSTSNITDQLAGEVFYLNQKNRFNWGADLIHVPYIRPFYNSYVQQIDLNGQVVTADVFEEIREVQTVTDVSGLAQYPFSVTRRIEASAGIERYAYKAEVDRFFIVGNTVVDRERERLPGGFTLNLAKASTAFVGDNSTYGFISPVRGTRYRYEVEAMQGDLKFTTALADWRKYYYARPVTFGIRALHYGRYGGDSESGRLTPLYLGQGNLVRGYDPYSFNIAAECPATGPACPTLDRLIGSRIIAAGAEIRAPLFGTPEYGLINTSFLPTEVFAFADGGAAYTSEESVTWKYDTKSNERVPVLSVGAGLRILLSYIPIEIYVAKPFHRPTEDVIYGFNIASGW